MNTPTTLLRSITLVQITFLALGCLPPADLGSNPIDPLSPQYSPTPPKNVRAYMLSTNVVQVAWDDISLGETGYQVSRSQNINQDFVPLADLPANAFSYVDSDTALVGGQTYYYRVRGFTPTLHGEYSFAAIVTLP